MESWPVDDLLGFRFRAKHASCLASSRPRDICCRVAVVFHGASALFFHLGRAMITERDIDILRVLVRYYVLNRQQIQRLAFPSDPNGRVTRRRLQTLVDEHLINRQGVLICHPTMTPAPVYFPSRKGCELLAEHEDDERILATPTQPPIHHHTFHWLAVSDTHITLDAAMAAQTAVQIEGWINEYDVVNKDESAPDKRFRLYTLIRETPRLICAPDAAFLLSTKGHKKIFYLEQDRATSGVQQIASGKTPGYVSLAERNLQQRHFQATVPGFTVLMVAPTERRRDALRKAIQEKPGAGFWKFASTTDLTPEKALHAPIWYSCGKDVPDPLVKGSAA
jgi:hypothetical protein